MAKFRKKVQDKVEQTIQDIVALVKAILDLTKIYPKMMLTLIGFHVAMYTHMILHHWSDVVFWFSKIFPLSNSMPK